jgi:hypothetical protein
VKLPTVMLAASEEEPKDRTNKIEAEKDRNEFFMD